MVLLDFVADKDLAIPREQSSDAEMWADLREAAERVGSDSAFPEREQGTVEDDHTPFVERGVPSIDLIDFDFPCWHQTCDDITAVSKALPGQERRGRPGVPQEPLRAMRIARAERSTSASVVAQVETEIRSAVAAVPDRAAGPAGAVGLDPGDRARRARRRAPG